MGPFLLLDKAKRPFFVEEVGIESLEELLIMYSSFAPRPTREGLPPRDERDCELWITRLLDSGKNLVGLRPDGKVIGHCAILPSEGAKEAEFMIFVHQRYRRLGIGMALTFYSFKVAQSIGVERLWLWVGATNVAAIRLYLKAGFSFKERERDGCHMELLFP